MEVPPNNRDCPQCELLLEQIKRLEQRLEAVEREGKRQAAPFRKKRKPLPKKSGRKKGDDYNQFTFATHQQCLAHLLRRCDSLIESGTGGALSFPRRVRELLLRGLEVRDRYRQGVMRFESMPLVADYLTNQTKKLTRRQRTNKANQRLANFLRNHVGELFTFPRYPGADATNWRGEQAIRPAVVNRKVWGGNRTGAGALAQSRIMSVMQTSHQRFADPFDFLVRQLTTTEPLTLPLPIAAR